MNNYIITYDPLSLSPSYNQILNHLQISKFINQFYMPFSGTILVKSAFDAPTLNGSLKGMFDSAAYFIALLDTKTSGGALSQDAWNWLNFGLLPKAPIPTPAHQQGLWDHVSKSQSEIY